MRELRLKYVLEMVSNIGSKARTDQQALTMAQKEVQEALKKTSGEASLLERVLLRVGGVAGKSAEAQAAYISRLALRYQDLRRSAEGAANAMTRASQLGAGMAAGAYAADRIAKTPMDYSERLAHMANTAFRERDEDGRVRGKQTLNAAITAAIRAGGGSRDDAAATLESLIASGALSVGDSIRMLPTLMRASTASRAPAEQLGAIGIRGMQSFGIKIDQIPEVLNMAMAAGQAGGFELRDMAKWLPQAMAMGKSTGLSGMEGMRRILASMQASVITSGTRDEAGNNLVNLLGKINARDTAQDVDKATLTGNMKKGTGIDLTAYLAGERAKGVNSLDAFVGLVDKIAMRDKEYVALKAKMDAATTLGERRETVSAMTDLLQGKAIGQVIQDRQALMALVAEMNNRAYVQRVMQDTRDNPNELQKSFGVIDREVSTSRQRGINAKDIAAYDVFEKAAPALKAAADTAVNLSERFPTLTMGVVAATGALTVFTAALGGSGLIGLLTGRAGAGMATTTMAGGAAAGIAKAGRAVFGRLGLYGALGYQLWNTGDALQQLHEAKTRQGVTLSPYARRRLAGVPELNLPDVSQIGNELLSLSPSGIGGAGAKIGEGRLDVNIRVTDDRATATTTVGLQPSLVRINTGNTNPAGYGPAR